MKSYNNKNSCNPFVLCKKDSNSRNTYWIVLTELLPSKKNSEEDQCVSKLLEMDFVWIWDGFVLTTARCCELCNRKPWKDRTDWHSHLHNLPYHWHWHHPRFFRHILDHIFYDMAMSRSVSPQFPESMSQCHILRAETPPRSTPTPLFTP